MKEATIEDLIRAVESQHGGTATFVETANVIESWQGKTVFPVEINKKQRRILIAVAVVIAAMMLYPPYYFPREPETTYSRAEQVRHEYGWLFGGYWGRVDVDLLLAQFLAVGIVGGIAYILCADKK